MIYCPTNALNYIKLLNCQKPIKLIKASPTLFRFTQEPSSGSYNQCLAKIASLCSTVRVGADVVSDNVCTGAHCWTKTCNFS